MDPKNMQATSFGARLRGFRALCYMVAWVPGKRDCDAYPHTPTIAKLWSDIIIY